MIDSLTTSDHVSNSASLLRYQEVFVIANYFFHHWPVRLEEYVHWHCLWSHVE